MFCYLLIKGFLVIMGEEAIPLQERFFPTLSYYWELFNDSMRWVLLNLTSFFYQLIAYPSFVLNNYSVHVSGMGQVNIGNYCLGIQLWMYFAALILAYSGGKFNYKLLFILIGICLINIINVLRFIGLIFLLKFYPDKVYFSHEYIFNYLIYAFSIYMLIKWINKHSFQSNSFKKQSV